MGDDRVVNLVSSVLVLGPFLVQARYLEITDKRKSLYNRWEYSQGNSCRDRDELLRFQSQFQQKTQPSWMIFVLEIKTTWRERCPYSICPLASSSSLFLAIRGRYFTVVCRAHSENMSATGLLPWYAGRRIGFAGRGVRSVYLTRISSVNAMSSVVLLHVRNRGVAFHGMEQNIQACTNMHRGRT